MTACVPGLRGLLAPRRRLEIPEKNLAFQPRRMHRRPVRLNELPEHPLEKPPGRRILSDLGVDARAFEQRLGRRIGPERLENFERLAVAPGHPERLREGETRPRFVEALAEGGRGLLVASLAKGASAGFGTAGHAPRGGAAASSCGAAAGRDSERDGVGARFGPGEAAARRNGPGRRRGAGVRPSRRPIGLGGPHAPQSRAEPGRA